MKLVKLGEIAGEDNRKYTKDEGFEQLVNSIREFGCIEPPVVRKLKHGGGYRVVAGRRRIEALRQLHGGDGEADCVVLSADDPRNDEEIALAENVNRLEMHPLDEAALFSRMAEKGASVEKIAQYYARSPSAIYKRLRLASLIEELKGMFRDGKLNIAAAAVLAELPEGDQKDFSGLYGHKKEEINNSEIYQFVQKKQRYRINDRMKEYCAGCSKRTNNAGNDLFEEFRHLGDVCLDADCYRVKWYEMIGRALEIKIRVSEAADNKIYFNSEFSDGIPEMLYRKATHANFAIGKENVKFEILRHKDYEFTGETNRKKDACWQVGETFEGVSVKRIGYKVRPPKEESGEKESAGKGESRDIDEYGRETLKVIAADRGMTMTELAGTLKEKKMGGWDFRNEIEELVAQKVIARRIEEEKEEAAGVPLRNYMGIFLQTADNELYGSNTFNEKKFDENQKRWKKELLGEKTFAQIAAGLPDEVQRLFHFLLLCIGSIAADAPNLNTLKDIEKSENVFWQYAGMSKEEYKALYLETAREVTAEALEPKAKKKKSELIKKPKSEVRRCRVCGCTEDDCRQCIEKTGEPCTWVEEDLCSACANEEEDGYSFEADEEDPEADAA